MRMVAELADGWNYNRGPEGFEHKLAASATTTASAIGRDPLSCASSVERPARSSMVTRSARPTSTAGGAGADRERGQRVSCRRVHRQHRGRSIAQLRFFVERGAELIILVSAICPLAGSGDSMAERFMDRVAPVLRRS